MRIRTLSAAALLLALVFCSRDYNPFADASNARARVIARTFRTIVESDSLRIFTTYRMDIVVALHDLVDSCVMIVLHSRHGDTTVLHGPFGDSAYAFAFSMYDTGSADILVQTCRTGGDVITENFPVRAVSPLRQSPILGYQGNAVALATDSVGDRDVWYHWQFGDYAVINSPFARIDTVLTGIITSAGTGMLWISDVKNTCRSPAKAFAFSLDDTIAPYITLADTGRFVRGDTIVTGDSTFALRIRIVDPGSGIVLHAAVDGNDFDFRNGTLYTAVLRHLQVLAAPTPRTVTVEATDALFNRSVKNFRVVYSDSLAPSRTIALVVLSPANDTSEYASRQRMIVGAVENYACDSAAITLKRQVNDSAYADTVLVFNGCRGSWAWTADLGRDSNIITMSACNADGVPLSQKQLLIRYNPALVDTAPPVIADITVDGANAQGLITAATSVLMRIIAFDDGSSIDTLRVDDIAASDSAGKYVWYASAPLKHGWDTVTVLAIDKSGNRAAQPVAMARNSLPYVSRGLRNALSLQAEKPYRDTLWFSDPDQDPVALTLRAGPAGLSVIGRGVVWTPLDADTGKHPLVLELNDGYQSVTYACTLAVALAPTAPCSLSAAARHGTIAGGVYTLPIDTADTLSFCIYSADYQENQPYHVTILQDNRISVMTVDSVRCFDVALANNSPLSGDGSLQVIVADRLGNGDTVNLIIRRRRDIQYQYLLTFNTTSTGAAVMSPVTRVPLAVRLDTSAFDFSLARNGGALRFAKKNSVALPYEVETWDTAGKAAAIWVLMDTVYPNCDTQRIIMQWYRDSANASDPSRVFDTANGFAGVWHLGEQAQGLGSAGVYKDATANANNSADYIDSAAYPGVIGKAQYFDGVNDYISVPASSTLNFSGRSATISAWVKAPAPYPGQERLLFEHDISGRMGEYKLSTSDGSQIWFNFYRSSAMAIGAGNYADNAWHCLAATFDNQSRNARVYLDGAQIDITSTGASIGASNGPSYIGSRAGTTLFFRGNIDEMQVSNTARSAAWVRLAYENQKPGSAFITIGKQ